MTVNTTNITSGPYAGNGVADTFNYGFKVSTKDQLSVYETDDTGVQVLLTVDTDYTVNGVGVDGGGTITRTAGALPTGYTWYIRSDYEYTQLTAFQSQGAFFPDLHEDAMDKLTFLIQQLRDSRIRSFRLADNIDIDGDLTLAQTAAQRAGLALGFDDSGNLVLKTSFDSSEVNQEDLDKRHTVTVASVTMLKSLAPVDVAGNPVIFNPGMTVRTQGYYSPGDGGNGDYIIRSSGSPDEYGDHTLSNGNVAELIRIMGLSKQWGVKGDTVTDDTAAMTSLLTNNRVVRIDSGDFNLATWAALNLTNPIAIYCEVDADFTFGSSVDFIVTDSTVKLDGGNFDGCSRVVGVEDAGQMYLTVRGAKASNVQSLISARYDDNTTGTLLGCLVENNSVDTTSSWGIDISINSMRDLRILNNNIRNTKLRGIGVGNNATGENESANHHVYIENNVVEGVTQQGVIDEVQGIYVTGVQYAHVIGNNVFDVLTNSDFGEGIYVKAANTHISGNTLVNAGGNQGCIVMKGDLLGTTDEARRIIEENIIESDRANSIPTCPIYVQIDDAVIRNNTITGLFTRGIQWNDNEKNERTIIHGNVFIRCAVDYLIEVNPLCESTMITANHAVDIKSIFATRPTFVRFGASLQNAGQTADALILKNNVLRDFYQSDGSTPDGTMMSHNQGSDTTASLRKLIMDNNEAMTLTKGYEGVSGINNDTICLNNNFFDVATPFTSGAVTYTRRRVINNLGQADIITG